MKKVVIQAFLIVLLITGLCIYRYNENKDVETLSVSNDIMNDYEDIIIKHGSDNEKLIALTFDDGPDKDFTPQVLDILKQNDVKATFFVVGENVGWNPEILKREYEEGHEIGNHTFTHINVSKKGYEDIYKEINDVNKDYLKIIESSSIDFLNSNPTQVVYVSTCKYFYNNIDTSDTVITKEIYEWKSTLNEFKIKSREIL